MHRNETHRNATLSVSCKESLLGYGRAFYQGVLRQLLSGTYSDLPVRLLAVRLCVKEVSSTDTVITTAGMDADNVEELELLIRCVRHIRDTYGVEVYLEPGEAIALNAGYLVTEVMDIVENGLSVLDLDASAACHMPDVLEMPYRPPLRDSGKAGEKKKDKTILPERLKTLPASDGFHMPREMTWTAFMQTGKKIMPRQRLSVMLLVIRYMMREGVCAGGRFRPQ